MKKLLALLIILSMVNIAGAAVLKVVPVDIGESGGRLGLTLEDGLFPSDTIGLAIVLEYNPYYFEGEPYPLYDGYLLSSMDVDLEVSGPGTLDVVWVDPPGPPPPSEALGVHSNFGAWDWSGISGNAIDHIAGVAMTPIGPPADVGGIEVVWNLLLHCDGEGQVVIDLTWHGSTPQANQYSEYGDY